MILTEFEYPVAERATGSKRQYPYTATLDDGREVKFQVENMVRQHPVSDQSLSLEDVKLMLNRAVIRSDFKSALTKRGVRVCIQPSSIM